MLDTPPSYYRSVIEEWLGDDPAAILGPNIALLQRGDSFAAPFR